MNRFPRALCLAALAVVLSGCETMNADDCRHANWDVLGRDDALHGRSRDMINQRAEACHKYGYQINMRAYEQGWSEGLLDFCTPAGGAQFADKGGNYSPGYCPPGTESAFLSGYTPAHERYQFRRKVENLRNEIEYREDDIRKLRSKHGHVDERRINDLEYEIQQRRRELDDLMLTRALDR